MKKTAAIFIDRDGVINKRMDTYVTDPREFVFEQGAIEGLRAISALGLPIFIVTNQSILRRGLADEKMLKRIHDKMEGELWKAQIRIRKIYYCPHLPGDGCLCRKPQIGMLLQAQEEFKVDLGKSFVIGDATGDMQLGKNAGCKTILVRTGYGGGDGRHQAVPDFVCDNLAQAAKAIKGCLENSGK